MGELKTEKSNESIDRLVTKNGKLKENLKNLQKILEENAQKLQILKQEEEELVKKSKKRCQLILLKLIVASCPNWANTKHVLAQEFTGLALIDFQSLIVGLNWLYFRLGSLLFISLD